MYMKVCGFTGRLCSQKTGSQTYSIFMHTFLTKVVPDCGLERKKRGLNLKLVGSLGRWVGINTKIQRPFASLELARCVNPKEAGSFDSISQPGGGGGGFPPPPPLGPRPRSAEKLCNSAHTYTMSRRRVSRNFHTETQSDFQIMQIYVNYMHIFIFLIIFDKTIGFWVSKSFEYCHK